MKTPSAQQKDCQEDRSETDCVFACGASLLTSRVYFQVLLVSYLSFLFLTFFSQISCFSSLSLSPKSFFCSRIPLVSLSLVRVFDKQSKHMDGSVQESEDVFLLFLHNSLSFFTYTVLHSRAQVCKCVFWQRLLSSVLSSEL